MAGRDLWQRLSSHLPMIRKPGMTQRGIGDQGERRAQEYLCTRQLTLVETNYRCPFGEIDLVMRDRDCLVFVEVKRRKHSRYGSPLEMVSLTKQQKLRRSAEHYITQKNLSHNHQPMRFDVVGIIANADVEESVQWVQNAF